MLDSGTKETFLIEPSCPHCGKQFNPSEKCAGAYARDKGWTSEIVEQAAIETGLDVYEGLVPHGNDPKEWLGLWHKNDRTLSLKPFFDRARELRELA